MDQAMSPSRHEAKRLSKASTSPLSSVSAAQFMPSAPGSYPRMQINFSGTLTESSSPSAPKRMRVEGGKLVSPDEDRRREEFTSGSTSDVGMKSPGSQGNVTGSTFLRQPRTPTSPAQQATLLESSIRAVHPSRMSPSSRDAREQSSEQPGSASKEQPTAVPLGGNRNVLEVGLTSVGPVLGNSKLYDASKNSAGLSWEYDSEEPTISPSVVRFTSATEPRKDNSGMAMVEPASGKSSSSVELSNIPMSNEPRSPMDVPASMSSGNAALTSPEATESSKMPSNEHTSGMFTMSSTLNRAAEVTSSRVIESRGRASLPASGIVLVRPGGSSTHDRLRRRVHLDLRPMRMTRSMIKDGLGQLVNGLE